MALKMAEIYDEQLKDTDKDLGKYLRGMTVEQFKKFAEHAVITYGSRKKLEEANAVIHFLRAYYKKMKILVPNADPTFIELMEVAAFIHNLFINDSWTSVFRAREVLYDLAVKEHKISYENAEHIFAIVEAQLGVDMPVPGCRSQSATRGPVDDFATACWVVKEYLERDKSYSSLADKGKS